MMMIPKNSKQRTISSLFCSALLPFSPFLQITNAFVVTNSKVSSALALKAKPSRLSENVDGPLYVNDKCINCSACSHFAPSVFDRNSRDSAHVVYKQPQNEQEIADARAALAACPVAAIRVETKAERNHRNLPPPSPEEEALAPQLSINPKFNGLDLPFPRPLTTDVPNVYFLGHHNEKSFGATPYLLHSSTYGWIMVDTPRYVKSAIQAAESLTGSGNGPDYLVLTHVDDTADHGKWKEHYPNLKRVFHTGDLGRHNWLGDKTLETVEVLVQGKSQDSVNAPLQTFDLNGNPIETNDNENSADVVLIHTPGHSPGSISLHMKPSSSATPGILFTGDTYAWTTRGNGGMSAFPRYGNNLPQQSRTIERLVNDFDWSIIAPGHGHMRDYRKDGNNAETMKKQEMEVVVNGLVGGRRI